jgi:hypothetical protein
MRITVDNGSGGTSGAALNGQDPAADFVFAAVSGTATGEVA